MEVIMYVSNILKNFEKYVFVLYVLLCETSDEHPYSLYIIALENS